MTAFHIFDNLEEDEFDVGNCPTWQTVGHNPHSHTGMYDKVLRDFISDKLLIADANIISSANHHVSFSSSEDENTHKSDDIDDDDDSDDGWEIVSIESVISL